MAAHPTSYHMQDYHRPRTPGTPGTFDTGYSGNFQDNAQFASQYDPHNRAMSPSPVRLDEGQNTYYFEKNGAAGGSAAAGGVGGAAGARGASRGGFFGWIKRHPWWTALVALIIVAAAVGGAVGGIMGGKPSKESATSGSSNTSSGNSKSGSGSGSSGSSSNGSNGSGSNTPAVKPITPLAKWNLTDPNSKMVGVSLGNWLVLERWLDEDWFTGLAGSDAYDEWHFTQALGTAKATTELQNHWNSFISESDIDSLKSVGINTVRVPIGYWAFVDSAQGEPYLSKIGQTDQLQKLLGWLYDRGMYAMIDLHGMPGSQNGDQSSGHNTSSINWFDNDNIGYSYVALNATIDWIKQSNYSSVVHSVCPVNEPRPTSSSKIAILTQYYETSYQLLKNAGLIMMFHHGFLTNPFDAWRDFATGKDPNYLSYNSNPYPGWFPSNSDADGIVAQVCQLASDASNFPIPVVMTEYSVANGVGTSSFNKEYYNTQLSAYTWSGGSVFWTYKALHSSNPVKAEKNSVMDLYSLSTLIGNGIVQKVDNTKSSLSNIKSLPNQQCGNIPTVKWSNPSGKTSSSKKRNVSKRSQQ